MGSTEGFEFPICPALGNSDATTPQLALVKIVRFFDCSMRATEARWRLQWNRLFSTYLNKTPKIFWCLSEIQKDLFLVAPCCSQGATLQVTLTCPPVVCPVVCPGRTSAPPPTPKLPPKHDFWAAQAILSNFCFWKKKNWHTPQNFFCPKFFFIQNFFHSKFFFIQIFFFHLQKNFPTFTFLCISGCFMLSWVLKKIFTQNFSGWSKARHNATKHF